MKLPVNTLILGALTALHANAMAYSVSFNTGFLAPSLNYVDFQFTQGGPGEIGAEIATVAHLSVPTAPASFSLVDGTPLGVSPSSSEDYFIFSAGPLITFDLSLTDAVTSSITPDLLAIYVEDFAGGPLSTTDSSGANTLITFTESTNLASPGISVAIYDTPTTNQFDVTVAEVPEPGTLILGSLTFFLILWSRPNVKGWHRLPPVASATTLETAHHQFFGFVEAINPL